MSWILDVAFFVIILIGILIGVGRGFIAGICKLAGTVLAVAVGVLFCNGFASAIGLTDALVGAIAIPKLGGWLAVGISFVILLVVTKLAAWLLGKLGTALAEKVKLFSVINRLCGGLLGLCKALILIFLLLSACYWLNEWLHLEALENFISNCAVVGAIFRWEGFVELAHFKFLFPNA